jgi:hypothetical protein
MLRRILILLGETSSSLSARQYALRLARNAEAELAGLAGIDLSYEALVPGRVGASAYKASLEEKLRRQADEMRVRLHEVFESECRAKDLNLR